MKSARHLFFLLLSSKTWKATATEHRKTIDWVNINGYEKFDSRHLNLLNLMYFPLNYTTKIQYTLIFKYVANPQNIVHRKA